MKKIFKRALIFLQAAIVIAAVINCSVRPDDMADKASMTLEFKTGSHFTNLVKVGFSSRTAEPSDSDVKIMADEVIFQILGPKGLDSIVKKGDKVVIKVNNVGPYVGLNGEKGRGVITDPRLVRYIAEKVRDIIGSEGSSDLKVVDGVYSPSKNPSDPDNKQSFYWARLERSETNGGTVYYDEKGSGFLDGGSKAKLVNLDAIGSDERFLARVKNSEGGYINVWMPFFMRTKEDALKYGPASATNEFCDVLIGLPVFKSHGFAGVTGALKLDYGFRPVFSFKGETGRFSHSGLGYDYSGMHNEEKLFYFLCAQHRVRDYDLIIMDCLAGNRRGPTNPTGGVSSVDYSLRVDYILTHAMMASVNSVAIDTAEAVLAGYDASSIELLGIASSCGLGPNDPGLIELCGLTNFSSHRKWLYDTYSPKGLYPFQNRWGVSKAETNVNLSGPGQVFLSRPERVKGGIYNFKFGVNPSASGLKITRIDLLVDGKIFISLPDASVRKFTADLRPFLKHTIACRIAVWDGQFNCSISDENSLKL